jgi:hypothetical protein
VPGLLPDPVREGRRLCAGSVKGKREDFVFVYVGLSGDIRHVKGQPVFECA